MVDEITATRGKSKLTLNLGVYNETAYECVVHLKELVSCFGAGNVTVPGKTSFLNNFELSDCNEI